MNIAAEIRSFEADRRAALDARKAARQAALRAARGPVTLGVQPDGSFRGLATREDGSTIIVTVPGR